MSIKLKNGCETIVCINLSDRMGVGVGPNFRQKCCTHCDITLQDAVPKSSAKHSQTSAYVIKFDNKPKNASDNKTSGHRASGHECSLISL